MSGYRAYAKPFEIPREFEVDVGPQQLWDAVTMGVEAAGCGPWSTCPRRAARAPSAPC